MVKIANKMKLVGNFLRRKMQWNVSFQFFWVTLFLDSHSERPNAGHGNDDGNADEGANAQHHPEHSEVATEEEGSWGGLLF